MSHQRAQRATNRQKMLCLWIVTGSGAQWLLGHIARTQVDIEQKLLCISFVISRFYSQHHGILDIQDEDTTYTAQSV